MLRWLISWGQCRRCHWSPQPSCVLQVLQVLLALWLPETTKQRAAVSVVQGHGQTGGKFRPELQNQMKIYRTNTSEREKKKSTLCLRGSWPSWLVGVCGRNCPIILSLPYYCAAVITLLGFQLKSNCPPFDWNRYCTNGYKSSEFKSHETVVGTIMMFRNM